MKRFFFLALCAALLTLAPARSEAGVAVSFGFFYDELAPYGNWVDVDGYGYCFQPAVSSGWRPYYNGDWVYTDDGWCWSSNESWGWATYHYGRWAYVRGCGWVWVPGYEWAPAWVSWRVGPDYCGWAPLPPECRWNGSRISFGASFGFDIGPSYYNFCSPRYFGYGDVGRHCAPWRNNVNIIQQTTNITNITTVVNNRTTVINSGGPGYDFIRRNSDRPIRRVKIERMSDAGELRKNGRLKNDLKGDTLRVVSPKIAKDKNAKPKTVAAKASSRNVDRGWSGIKDENRAKELRDSMKNESKTAANRPAQVRESARNGENTNAGKNRDSRSAEADRSQKNAAELKPFLAGTGKKSQQVANGSRDSDNGQSQRERSGKAAQNRQEAGSGSRQSESSNRQKQKEIVEQTQRRQQAATERQQQQKRQAAEKKQSDAVRRSQIQQQNVQRQQEAARRQQVQKPSNSDSRQVQRSDSQQRAQPSQIQIQRSLQQMQRPSQQRSAPGRDQRSPDGTPGGGGGNGR